MKGSVNRAVAFRAMEHMLNTQNLFCENYNLAENLKNNNKKKTDKKVCKNKKTLKANKYGQPRPERKVSKKILLRKEGRRHASFKEREGVTFKLRYIKPTETVQNNNSSWELKDVLPEQLKSISIENYTSWNIVSLEEWGQLKPNVLKIINLLPKKEHIIRTKQLINGKKEIFLKNGVSNKVVVALAKVV